MQKIQEKTETSEDSVENLVPQSQYLKENFPIEADEYKVDYKPVGKNKFRINFWSKRERSSTLCGLYDSYISRSHYVVLKRDNLSWSHKII